MDEVSNDTSTMQGGFMRPEVRSLFIEDCGWIAVQMKYCEELKYRIKQIPSRNWRYVRENGVNKGMAWCIDPAEEEQLRAILEYTPKEFNFDAAFLDKGGIAR